MNITEITKQSGAHKQRKRIGRGAGSGHGKTSGRGHKGAGQRAGGKKTGLFEGGMFPFFRRIPKVGFSNFHFRREYQIVNLGDLEKHCAGGAAVNAELLAELGLIRDSKAPVKVLADGELTKKLNVEAHRFSGTATAKIEALGGSAKWLEPKPKKKAPRPAPASKSQPEKKKKAKPGAEGEPEQAKE